jgi:hypothetical protein
MKGLERPNRFQMCLEVNSFLVDIWFYTSSLALLQSCCVYCTHQGKTPRSFCVVFFGSFPTLSLSWDRQTAPTIQRKEKGRDRVKVEISTQRNSFMWANNIHRGVVTNCQQSLDISGLWSAYARAYNLGYYTSVARIMQ